MEYFKREELVKICKNNKTYIGGYAVNCKDYNTADDLTDIFNGNLIVPNIYFKIYPKTTNNKLNEKYDTTVVSETLHNRLLGLSSNKNKTKKIKDYNKKTKKNKQ